VKVSIVLDKMQQSEKYSDATYFHNKGMAVLIDPKHAIAHNKVILIDERVIITGSFNFSANAEDDNAENLLIIEDKKDLMTAYLKNFGDHASHAVPYKWATKTGATKWFDNPVFVSHLESLELSDRYFDTHADFYPQHVLEGSKSPCCREQEKQTIYIPSN